MASVNVEKSEKNKKMVVWLNPKQLLINNKRCVFLNDSDLIGKKFNKFVVLDVFSKNGRKKCKCLCDCGKVFVRDKYNVVNDRTYSCGCIRRDVKPMIGKVFGRLKVLSLGEPYYTPNRERKDLRYVCECECGNIVSVRGKSLRSGHTVSCGCVASESLMGVNLENLVGQTFGYWKVISYAGRVKEPRGRYATLWRCHCKCGTVRDIRAGSLKGGTSLSCGCYKYSQTKKSLSIRFKISKLESYVISFLEEQSINFSREVIFNDLYSKSGYPLSYDFKILLDDKEILIECQGKQHYEPIEYFGGEKQFIVQRNNDILKKFYAFKNGYYLFYIPYYLKEENIYTYLENILIKKSLFS